MANPWEEIDLNTYEKHMSLENVHQLQTLNKIMKEQFYAYPAKSVMILGVAGGNGLEHIDRRVISKVYGVDINSAYLEMCAKRYPELQGVLETIHADLTRSAEILPHAELVVADLVVEYIGCECFVGAVGRAAPRYVSVVIQINEDTSFVSDSPYIREFDRLEEVHHKTHEVALAEAMEKIGYEKVLRSDEPLPNGKRLVRIDFMK